MTEREFAIAVVRRLQEAGHEALWAGGCVRDELLGLTPKDYDIATDARPERVRSLFQRTLAVGASFGVIEVLGPKGNQRLTVEVATFRSDGVYSDGRRPDEVVFSTPREDALRRDFTINGMFFNPLEGRLIDYVDGRDDLHRRVLRAIGDPHRRFDEDKLRLLRGVRLATRFELTIDPGTAAAIQANAAQINVVSAERIAEELRQLLVHPRRSRGVALLEELGLVAPLLPEMLPLKEKEGALWKHVLTVLDYLGPQPSFPLAMTGLLHEIGPVGEGREHAAALIADGIALRLKLSNSERERIVWLVQNQRVLREVRTMRTCRLKQLLVQPGIHELLTLQRADSLALGEDVGPVEFCEQRLREWTPQELNPEPFITGDDLIALGMKPGPRFKEILGEVRDAQLDGTIHNRAEALDLARRLLSQ